jgi:RHS repeat-associated protein
VTVTTNYQNGVFDPTKPDEDLPRITHYDPAGNVLEQIDALGNITRNYYDSLNRVISTTANYTTTPGVDPNTYNLTMRYEYDPAGQQVAITDTVQHVTRNYYDPVGRLISTTVNFTTAGGPNYSNQYNLTTRFEYDAVGNRLAMTDALSTPTRYTYDPLNRVSATTNVSGTTTTRYDAIGNRVAVTDALTHTTIYTYNAVGQLIAEGNPVIGNFTRYQYDPLGRTIVVTDPLTHTTRTAYDDAGRVVSTTNALTGTTVITYNALGQRVGFIDENGKSSYTAYDGLGRTSVLTDAAGSTTRFGYDALGNRTQVIDGLGHPMTSTYDAANRLIMTQDALGNSTRFGYDGLSNRVTMTDANGVVTRYGYDAVNRLSVVTESMTTTVGLDLAKYNVVTRYAYDPLGNRIAMTDALTHTTVYTYDRLSRLIAVRDPLTHTTQYVYDAVGNRTKTMDANGQTITSTFDALNRNTKIQYGAYTVTLEYDQVGNRTAMTDSLGTTRYAYDELNRLKQFTDPFTGTVQYRYDAVGNRTQTIYPDGKVVTYTFDAANRLTGTLSWDGQLTTYAFDQAGRLVTTTLPNGVQTVNTYDEANRTTRLTHRRSGTTLADYQFALDRVGNRTIVTETVQSPASGGGDQFNVLQGLLDDVLSGGRTRRLPHIEQVSPELFQEQPPRPPDLEDLLTPTPLTTTPTPTPTPTPTGSVPAVDRLHLISWQPDRLAAPLETANLSIAHPTTLQQSGGTFPSTLVIDNFNRPDGPLDGLWFSHTSGYTLTNQQLGYVSGHSIYWNAWFGTTQEAFMTLATIDTSSTAEAYLLLKVQGTYYGHGAILVGYFPSDHVAAVYTTLPNSNEWVQQGGDIAVTFQNGDIFGARARVDGTLEVYRNSTLLASVDISSWPYYATMGRIGLILYDAPTMRLDDFGGGGVSDAIGLVPLGGVWKYLDNGSDQGTAWRGSGFDDSSWPSGTAQLGYGDGDETTVVSYGSDYNNKYITTYFRRTITVADPTQYQNLLLRLQRDDGAVVYLNGSEVFRSNMPGGVITYTTLAFGAVNEVHFYTATVPITALVSGANQIAVEVHQASASSSDISFDLELAGTPRADTLLPQGASWKYLDNGSDQGTAWRSPSFNDSAWSSGAAQLGYGDGDEATVVSYGPDPNNKYITTYFRKAFTVTNPLAYQRLPLQLLVDDGSVVYLNGTEVLRTYLPTNTSITSATLTLEAMNEPEQARFSLYYLSPSLLVTGTNVLAVEVHQQGPTTADNSFDLALLGQIGTTPLTATVIAYTYDPLYRLTNANYSGAYTYTFGYGYDAVGNRTVQTRTITSTQVITYVYDNANRMTQAGGVTYTWDNNGNLINDGNALYRYDPANRLISTTLGGTTSLFNYNGDGARLKQVVAGVPTTYTQDLAAPLPVVLQAKTGVTTTKYAYSLGTRPIAQNTTAWEYLLPDALGSVRQIADSSGNVTLAKSYEPYGTVLTSTGTATSIFGFSGEQVDSYTGLIYLRARYMQPRLGIFLARDPWSGDVMQPGSMNGWNFVEGNPINRTDPSGRFSAVAIANTVLHGPTLAGIDRSEWAFASMGDHYGWISLLLDADESNNYVHNWSNLTQRETYGHIRCSEDGQSLSRDQPFEGVNTSVEWSLSALPRPRPMKAIWWRDNGVYSLITQGQERFYLDAGDDGHTSDLPDFKVLAGGSLGEGLSFSGAGFQDRFGRIYVNGAIGPSASPPPLIGSIFLGEGYAFMGNVWNVTSNYLNERELDSAIRGTGASLSAGLIIGSQININTCAASWDIGPCYGAVIYTTGLQVSVGVSGGGTIYAGSKSGEAWDWMFHAAGPSRAEVWQRWLKSTLENPCGGCSAAK